MSVALYISGTIYHMIYICGTGLDKLRAWWRVFTQHTCIMHAKILAGTKLQAHKSNKTPLSSAPVLFKVLSCFVSESK